MREILLKRCKDVLHPSVVINIQVQSSLDISNTDISKYLLYQENNMNSSHTFIISATVIVISNYCYIKENLLLEQKIFFDIAVV